MSSFQCNPYIYRVNSIGVASKENRRRRGVIEREGEKGEDVPSRTDPNRTQVL